MNKSARDILRAPYTRLLVADEVTGRFAARIAEFSGCFAEGKTAADAARKLENAAEAWIEAVLARGQKVPEPEKESEYSGKFVVRLPRSLHERCALSAAKEGVSLNQFVVYALATHLGARKAVAIDFPKIDVAQFYNLVFQRAAAIPELHRFEELTRDLKWISAPSHQTLQ
jgi:antitoxin HicB